MTILTVVIGIVFVLLLLSLLATTLMELLSSFFRLRGRNLLKALQNMLASQDEHNTLVKLFEQNSMYKHLTQQYGRRPQGPPSYMSAQTFQNILLDVIMKGDSYDKLKERIAELPDEDLRNVLNQLLRQANNNLDHFKREIEKWYDNVMDRASGWYKRRTQQILLLMGLGIAVLFNADTFSIYERLSSDPQNLQEIVALAENYVRVNENTDFSQRENVAFDQALDDLELVLANEIESIRSPLGLGWEGFMNDAAQFGPLDWLGKVLGFFVTALAISLGAPFWFDLLRKLVNIRAAGKKPE
jgi:hypothetical protein